MEHDRYTSACVAVWCQIIIWGGENWTPSKIEKTQIQLNRLESLSAHNDGGDSITSHEASVCEEEYLSDIQFYSAWHIDWGVVELSKLTAWCTLHRLRSEKVVYASCVYIYYPCIDIPIRTQMRAAKENHHVWMHVKLTCLTSYAIHIVEKYMASSSCRVEISVVMHNMC